MVKKTLRIGIDARWLEQKPTGIGVYLTEVLSALLKADPINTYYLYSNREIHFNSKSKNIEFRQPKGLQKILPGTIWLNTFAIKSMIRDSINIFWGSAFILPLKLPENIKTILTIHDCAFALHPETLTRYNRTLLTHLVMPSIQKADLLVTVSQQVKKDLLMHLMNRNIFDKQVSYIYNGINPKEYYAIPPKDARQQVKDKYAVTQPYLFCAATLEPRKGFLKLLMSFKQSKKLSDKYLLIISGKKGWKFKPILHYMRENKMGNKVKLLDYIDKEDLKYFYSGAECFINPSVYEGFGLQNLEALACGCKIAVSDIPVFREILGDKAQYFKRNAKDIESTIIRALSIKRTENNSIIQKYSWTKTAQNMLKLFHSIGGSRY